MLISFGYDICLDLYAPSTVLMALRVRPAEDKNLVEKENFSIEPNLPFETYHDFFGNRCNRVFSPAGPLTIRNTAIIRNSGEPDLYAPDAKQEEISDLPLDVMQFLLSSRYCEVDSELGSVAFNEFGSVPPGWKRVQAISDFCHEHIKFDYQNARCNRTALETYREKTGVCRDFTHLAITFCRAMNIPARYVTGYLGDIGVPPAPHPMDFSAWMEVFLGGRWYAFDPRNNRRRIGRIVIAHGRDASDVAITTVFGDHDLIRFNVHTEEIPAIKNK